MPSHVLGDRALPRDLPPWPTPEHVWVTTNDALAGACNVIAGASAIGLWIPPDAAEPLHPRARSRRPRLLAIAIEATEPHARAYVLDLSRVDNLSPLAGALSGHDAPYVVLHDAQPTLARLEALGLHTERFGSITIALQLLGEAPGRGYGDRTLAHGVERILSHTVPELLLDLPGSAAVDPSVVTTVATQASTLIAAMRSVTPQLRARGLVKLYELEHRLLPAVVAMENAGMPIDGAAFERIVAGWQRERSGTVDDDRITRLDKLLSTYGHWARDFVDLDGRMRCRLHPLAADSGRFACSEPNLQQVPNEHTAPGLRACFRAPAHHKLIIADYAQIELRVAAHMAPCDALRGVFLRHGDPHRATAARMTGRAEHEISEHERKLAKAVNFGFLFGMGAERFRDYALEGYGVELDAEQARAARAAFLRTFPGIAAWHRRIADLGRNAADHEVSVTTVMGRRKRFAAGRFSYATALNIPVQGTAAEGFKLAMTRLHQCLPSVGARGILCIHDEYIAEVPEAHAEEARRLVAETMRESMAELVPSVPIEVDARIADHWGRA